MRGAAGLFDLSPHGRDRGRRAGGGRVPALRASSRTPRALEPGQAQYSMLCDEDGGIVDDLILLSHRRGVPGRLQRVEPRRRRPALDRAAGARRLRRDARRPVASGPRCVALQGPRAAEILAPADRRRPRRRSGNYRAARGSVAGIECLVARTGYTGEDGFELFCDARRAGRLWDALLEAGSPRGHRARAASARATRCGSRPACRSTATSSTRRRTRSRRTSAGS